MKNIISKILLVASILLIVLFALFVIVDYKYYNMTFSAPFSAYVLVRALEFILPSIVLLVICYFLKRKK